MVFYVCLFSLSIKPWRFKHVVVWWYVSVIYSFLLLSSISSYGWSKICLSRHLLVSIWVLFRFSLWCKASGKIYKQSFRWTYAFISLGELPRSGISMSYGKCMFNLVRYCPTVHQNGSAIFHPICKVGEIQLLQIHDTTWYYQCLKF